MDEIKKFSLGSTEPSKNTSPEFEKECMAFQIKWLEDCIKELKQSQQWQPIETAPKIPSDIDVENGLEAPVLFLLYIEGKKYPAIGGYISSVGKFWTSSDGFENFTHWMPLPKPPTQ